MYDGALLYVMFLVHTRTKDDVYDIGFDPRVFLWFFSDSVIDGCIVYGLLYLI